MREDMKESRRGIVLVVVLLVVVLLAAVLLEFNYEARLNLYAADNSSKSQQALCCAEAGLNIAIAVLNQEETDTHEAIKEWLSGGARIPVGDGFCVVSVAEENGKLNTNLLKEEDGVIARRRADQMLRLIDLLNLKREGDSLISYEVVPGIMDWVDADDDVTSLPFVKDRLLRTKTPDGKTVRLPPPAVPTPYLDKTGGELRFSPAYGEHTDSVLAEIGVSTEEISRLRAKGIVA